jgi:D-aspartate ligase
VPCERVPIGIWARPDDAGLHQESGPGEQPAVHGEHDGSDPAQRQRSTRHSPRRRAHRTDDSRSRNGQDNLRVRYLARAKRLDSTMRVAVDVVGSGTRVSEHARRVVTVFDVDLPPGLAFIRSLGRAGVPVMACSAKRMAAGRLSRHVSGWRRSPAVRDCDRFITWLTEQLGSGAIDLVAPTSDWVMFCVAEAMERLGLRAEEVGHPEPEHVRTCLFKDRFASALTRCGFPTPPAGVPTSLPVALVLAEELGYPVLLKPRSHVGVGTTRGVVIHTPEELRAAYRPFVSDLEQRTVRRHLPGLCLPMVQRYHDLGTVDVISVSGCLGSGEVLALHHSRKITQAPARLGVGTMFEPVGPQPFTDAAVEVVRRVLGSGLFELEVLVDRCTGEYAAIDLNPRGFGQMTLDMAAGNDLPRLWYESVTGARPASTATVATPPRLWQDGVASYAGLAVGVARGPARTERLGHALDIVRAPKVGAAFTWSDPLPGVVFGLGHLRHPRALLRQFCSDVECAAARAPGDDARPSDQLPRSAERGRGRTGQLISSRRLREPPMEQHETWRVG